MTSSLRTGLANSLLLALAACGTEGGGDGDSSGSSTGVPSTTATSTSSSTLTSSTTADDTSSGGNTMTTTTAETSDTSADSSSGGDYVRQHLLLEADFEGDDPFVDFSNEQHCCDHSVTQSDEQAHGGAYSFRAEVRADDPAVSSGWRAEIVPSSVSDTGLRWYGWSVYFETPQDAGMWTGSYGGHFVQWHPDNSDGSASLAIWGSDGIWEVRTNPEGDGSADPHGDLPITANEWHDVVFRVDWDLGLVTVWLDGEMYVDLDDILYAKGPGQYMKLGMNRWGNGPEGAPEDTWVIYYDDFRIGDELAQLEDVAP